MSEEYNFPFNSCEKVNEHGISQPYSTLVNVIDCIIIFFFLIKTTKYANFLFLGSIFLFQFFHFFSHMNHIKGSIQTNVIHTLAYFVNITLLFCLYSYTKRLPEPTFILFILLFVLFDIYSLFYLSTIFYLLSHAIILISLLIYYYSFLPKSVKIGINQIILIVLFILLLVVNETYNCKNMLNMYPDFPFHIFIEFSGICLFYVICSHFYNL
jgi:hypothetical protein